MKILQVGKFYPIRGGVEKVMYDIMLGASARGVSCDMLCAAGEGQQPGDIKINQNATLMCMSSLVKLAATMISPSMVFRLRKICKNYDIIHIHHPDPMACLALFLSGYKGKVILHWHSDILKQKTLLKLYSPLQSWLIKRADVIVGTTPVYVQKSPFLQNVQGKITYIPIGVEPMPSNEKLTSELKTQYAGKKIIFTLGRLVGYKGYEYLIESARYISDDYIILIGGKGPLKDEFTGLIEKWDLKDKVKLLGPLSDEQVSGYFGACDLFCLSSIWKTEAFGIVQIEAMSVGKPLVATNIADSGVSWVNENGISGLNVEPEDAKALAGAFTKMLSDEAYYQTLSKGAKERYESLFTRDKMIDNCLELYKKVLE